MGVSYGSAPHTVQQAVSIDVRLSTAKRVMRALITAHPMMRNIEQSAYYSQLQQFMLQCHSTRSALSAHSVHSKCCNAAIFTGRVRMTCIICNVFANFIICVSCNRTPFSAQRQQAGLFPLQTGPALLMKHHVPPNLLHQIARRKAGSHMSAKSDRLGDFQRLAIEIETSLSSVAPTLWLPAQ